MRRWITTLLFVLATGPLATAAPAPAKINTPFKPEPGMLDYADGLDALASFDLAKADELISKALEKSPDRIEMLMSRGLTRALNDDIAQIDLGVKDIEAALQQAPRRTDIKRLYIFALGRTGREIRLTDIYRYSTQDRFERLLGPAGGPPDTRGGIPLRPQEIAGKRARCRTVASVFAYQMKQGLDMAKVLFARALDRRAKKDNTGACNDLAIVVAQYPGDFSIAHHYARALTSVGDYERSRQIASLALRYEPAPVEAYCQRAIAAARMGNLTRAKLDLEIAKELDPKDTDQSQALTQKSTSEAESAKPAESPEELLKSLLDAARGGQSIEQLKAPARKLVLAGNLNRLHGDEVYQEKLRKLQWAAAAEPKNADRLGALGRFFFDEIDVRGEWIDPDETFSFYRLQTEPMQEWEMSQARQWLEKALAIDANHVPSLVGLASMDFRATRFGDAEGYARRAMAVRPNDPEVLDLMSKLMSIAAGQAMSRALAAATTTRSEVWGSDHVWVREERPTAAGYAYSNEMDRQAGALLEAAKAYTRAALASLKNNPESYDYLGTFGIREKKYDIAAKAYERAVQLAPQKIEYYYGLANAYSSLNDFDRYLGPATIGRNLEHTSIGAHLLGAWQLIGKGAFPTARVDLELAMKIDPADARIAAFLGALAEGEGKPDEAAACYRAAIAIEETRLANRGVSQKSTSINISDVARLIGIRVRLASLLESNEPKAAAELYLLNLAMESRMTPADMLQVVPDALLPVANQPHGKQNNNRRCPRGGEVMRRNCARAAEVLQRAGETEKAAEYARRVATYDEYLVQAGAKKSERFDTEGWGAVPEAAPSGQRRRGNAGPDSIPRRN